eukprot:scaffold6479_cov101-Isochrysis_galbana.AAC.2
MAVDGDIGLISYTNGPHDFRVAPANLAPDGVCCALLCAAPPLFAHALALTPRHIPPFRLSRGVAPHILALIGVHLDVLPLHDKHGRHDLGPRFQRHRLLRAPPRAVTLGTGRGLDHLE